MDCFIFCISFPESQSLEFQHFVPELFFLLRAREGEISVLTSLFNVNINGYLYNVWEKICAFSPSMLRNLVVFTEVYRLELCFLSFPLYPVTFPGFSILTACFQHPGVTHHIAGMIWDIVDLPPSVPPTLCIISILLDFPPSPQRCVCTPLVVWHRGNSAIRCDCVSTCINVVMLMFYFHQSFWY